MQETWFMHEMCFMQAVAGHVTQRIGQYSPQSLSNVMWAFATQETHPGSGTLDAAALFVCKTLQVCHPDLNEVRHNGACKSTRPHSSTHVMYMQNGFALCQSCAKFLYGPHPLSK